MIKLNKFCKNLRKISNKIQIKFKVLKIHQNTLRFIKNQQKISLFTQTNTTSPPFKFQMTVIIIHSLNPSIARQHIHDNFKKPLSIFLLLKLSIHVNSAFSFEFSIQL